MQGYKVLLKKSKTLFWPDGLRVTEELEALYDVRTVWRVVFCVYGSTKGMGLGAPGPNYPSDTGTAIARYGSRQAISADPVKPSERLKNPKIAHFTLLNTCINWYPQPFLETSKNRLRELDPKTAKKICSRFYTFLGTFGGGPKTGQKRGFLGYF
jgi:hypothetical protein